MTVQQDNERGRLEIAVGQILAKVDHIGEAVKDIRADAKEHRSEVNEALKEQSDRITAVERFQWKVLGIVAACGFILPLIVTVLIKVIA